jgi:hypothetical protein
MSNGWLKFIGAEANRVLTVLDLGNLGAEVHVLEKLGENAAVTFVKGVAQKVEPVVAEFIATHPALQSDFHTLSDDEAADEVAARTGNPAGGTSTSGSSTSTTSGDDGAPSTSGSSSASGETSTPSA